MNRKKEKKNHVQVRSFGVCPVYEQYDINEQITETEKCFRCTCFLSSFIRPFFFFSYVHIIRDVDAFLRLSRSLRTYCHETSFVFGRCSLREKPASQATEAPHEFG